MGTAKKMVRTGVAAGVPATSRAVRPAVRSRCSRTRTKEDVVREQLAGAMPEIVSATIEKARAGSLVHTKWLWGVANEANGEGAAESVSLAQMLLQELAECARSSKETQDS